MTGVEMPYKVVTRVVLNVTYEVPDEVEVDGQAVPTDEALARVIVDDCGGSFEVPNDPTAEIHLQQLEITDSWATSTQSGDDKMPTVTLILDNLNQNGFDSIIFFDDGMIRQKSPWATDKQVDDYYKAR
jgi:hypothetical protein